MKYDNSKWLIPLFSFAIYECWQYILYLIDYSYKDDMMEFLGLLLLGFFGIVLLIAGYSFIPVTQYFYEKGKEVFSIFVAMTCLLPSLAGSWLWQVGLWKNFSCDSPNLIRIQCSLFFDIDFDFKGQKQYNV